MMTFFPNEIWYKLIRYLPIRDVMHITMTCKSFYQDVNGLWGVVFKRDYPDSQRLPGETYKEAYRRNAEIRWVSTNSDETEPVPCPECGWDDEDIMQCDPGFEWCEECALWFVVCFDCKTSDNKAPLCKLVETPMEGHPIPEERASYYHRGVRRFVTYKELHDPSNWKSTVPCYEHEKVHCPECAWIETDHSQTHHCECFVDNEMIFNPQCGWSYEDVVIMLGKIQESYSMEMIDIDFVVSGPDGGFVSIWRCPKCKKTQYVTDK